MSIPISVLYGQKSGRILDPAYKSESKAHAIASNDSHNLYTLLGTPHQIRHRETLPDYCNPWLLERRVGCWSEAADGTSIQETLPGSDNLLCRNWILGLSRSNEPRFLLDEG